MKADSNPKIGIVRKVQGETEKVLFTASFIANSPKCNSEFPIVDCWEVQYSNDYSKVAVIHVSKGEVTFYGTGGNVVSKDGYDLYGTARMPIISNDLKHYAYIANQADLNADGNADTIRLDGYNATVSETFLKVFSMSFSPDSKYLLYTALSHDNEVIFEIHDVATNTMQKRIVLQKVSYSDIPSSISFDQNGSNYAVGIDYKMLQGPFVLNGNPTKQQYFDAMDIAFSDDGKDMAYMPDNLRSSNGHVIIDDAETDVSDYFSYFSNFIFVPQNDVFAQLAKRKSDGKIVSLEWNANGKPYQDESMYRVTDVYSCFVVNKGWYFVFNAVPIGPLPTISSILSAQYHLSIEPELDSTTLPINNIDPCTKQYETSFSTIDDLTFDSAASNIAYVGQQLDGYHTVLNSAISKNAFKRIWQPRFLKKSLIYGAIDNDSLVQMSMPKVN